MEKLLMRRVEQAKEIHRHVWVRTGTAIAAGFAFVMALTWNEAIKAAVGKLLAELSLEGDDLSVKLIAAILTSIVCIAGIWYFSRWAEEK